MASCQKLQKLFKILKRQKEEWDLLRKARKEVCIIYSTANALYIQERAGTIQFLNQLEEEGVSIKLLTPTDDPITGSIQNLKHHNNNNDHHHQQQQQHNKIIEFRSNIAPALRLP